MRPCGKGLPSFARLTQTVADRSSWNSSPNARAMDVAPGRLAIIGANAGGYRGRQMRPLAEVWRQPVPATDTLLGRAAAAVARQADDATTHGLQASLAGSPAATALTAHLRRPGQGYFVNAEMRNAGIDAGSDSDSDEPEESTKSRGVRSSLNCGLQGRIGAVVMDSAPGGLTWVASQQ